MKNSKLVVAAIAVVMNIIFIWSKMDKAVTYLGDTFSTGTWIAFGIAIFLYLVIKFSPKKWWKKESLKVKLFYGLVHVFFVFIIVAAGLSMGWGAVTLNLFAYGMIELVSEIVKF